METGSAIILTIAIVIGLIGTHFVASKECPASDISKQNIINAKMTDLIEFKAMPAWRSTPHELSLELYNMGQNGASSEEINKRMRDVAY